jgi:hypothetical protein
MTATRSLAADVWLSSWYSGHQTGLAAAAQAD